MPLTELPWLQSSATTQCPQRFHWQALSSGQNTETLTWPLTYDSYPYEVSVSSPLLPENNTC